MPSTSSFPGSAKIIRGYYLLWCNVPNQFTGPVHTFIINLFPGCNLLHYRLINMALRGLDGREQTNLVKLLVKLISTFLCYDLLFRLLAPLPLIRLYKQMESDHCLLFEYRGVLFARIKQESLQELFSPDIFTIYPESSYSVRWFGLWSICILRYPAYRREWYRCSGFNCVVPS